MQQRLLKLNLKNYKYPPFSQMNEIRVGEKVRNKYAQFLSNSCLGNILLYFFSSNEELDKIEKIHC